MLATGSNLVAKAFETILKITLIRAIGLYWEIDSAPGIFGIRERMPKFSLAMSMRPSTKSLRHHV